MKKLILIVALSVIVTSFTFLSNDSSSNSTAALSNYENDFVYPLSNRILPGG